MLKPELEPDKYWHTEPVVDLIFLASGGQEIESYIKEAIGRQREQADPTMPLLLRFNSRKVLTEVRPGDVLADIERRLRVNHPAIQVSDLASLNTDIELYRFSLEDAGEALASRVLINPNNGKFCELRQTDSDGYILSRLS